MFFGKMFQTYISFFTSQSEKIIDMLIERNRELQKEVLEEREKNIELMNRLLYKEGGVPPLSLKREAEQMPDTPEAMTNILDGALEGLSSVGNDSGKEDVNRKVSNA